MDGRRAEDRRRLPEGREGGLDGRRRHGQGCKGRQPDHSRRHSGCSGAGQICQPRRQPAGGKARHHGKRQRGECHECVHRQRLSLLGPGHRRQGRADPQQGRLRTRAGLGHPGHREESLHSRVGPHGRDGWRCCGASIGRCFEGKSDAPELARHGELLLAPWPRCGPLGAVRQQEARGVSLPTGRRTGDDHSLPGCDEAVRKQCAPVPGEDQDGLQVDQGQAHAVRQPDARLASLRDQGLQDARGEVQADHCEVRQGAARDPGSHCEEPEGRQKPRVGAEASEQGDQ
mmetsp:Transcript_149948/g.481836  ORF Transcript_149948/g.481836 Transcript_149948/m.481836 type:complete len:287 (-) Transcript_149948:3130-3990(-)